MPWLDDSYFEPLLRVVAGHRVGLVHNPHGNAGDQLIARGALELLQRHAIPARLLRVNEKSAPPLDDIDILAAPGGGSVGTFYTGGPNLRRRIGLMSQCRRIVFPQSAFDDGEDLSNFETVFVRETTSLEMLKATHGDVRLAPDLALSLRLPKPAPPRYREGLFMRNDQEKTGNTDGCDLALVLKTGGAYLARVAEFRIIRTNRLHLAIAGILQGREVYLRPGNYHKNRSMYETWLHLFPNVTWEEA